MATATANTTAIGAGGSTAIMAINQNDKERKKNNFSGWQRSGLDQRASKIQIHKDPMRSYVDLIIDPATNIVAHGGALSPDTDDASMEHFRTSSKQLN